MVVVKNVSSHAVILVCQSCVFRINSLIGGEFHTVEYIYLSLDELDGPCFLDESSVEESLHECSQISATDVHDKMPTTNFLRVL